MTWFVFFFENTERLLELNLEIVFFHFQNRRGNKDIENSTRDGFTIEQFWDDVWEMAFLK